MDTLVDFLNWAWARHHNPLSWYIRPLFILPFCYFAYRKSVRGMVATVVAVTSSMFWFPAPATADPTATTFLAVERQWITGPPTVSRLVRVECMDHRAASGVGKCGVCGRSDVRVLAH